MTFKRYDPRKFILRQGDYGETFYIIMRGSVDVFKKFPGNDTEEHVAHLTVGSGFGELALLHDEPRAASVRSATRCEVAVLQKGEFVDTLRRAPQTRLMQGVNFLQQLSAIRTLKKMLKGEQQTFNRYLLMLSYHFHEIKVKVGNIIQMENAPVQHVVVVKSGALSLRHSVQSRRTNRRGNDQNSYGEDYEGEEDIDLDHCLRAKTPSQRQKIELCEIGPCQVFGVHEALSNSQSGVKVIAVQNSILLTMDASVFRRVLPKELHEIFHAETSAQLKWHGMRLEKEKIKLGKRRARTASAHRHRRQHRDQSPRGWSSRGTGTVVPRRPKTTQGTFSRSFLRPSTASMGLRPQLRYNAQRPSTSNSFTRFRLPQRKTLRSRNFGQVGGGIGGHEPRVKQNLPEQSTGIMETLPAATRLRMKMRKRKTVRQFHLARSNHPNVKKRSIWYSLRLSPTVHRQL